VDLILGSKSPSSPFSPGAISQEGRRVAQPASVSSRNQQSIPPMPPPGAAGTSFFFGASATIASVVIIRPAIDAALDPFNI
jgi:hypothetical protein